MKKFFKWMAILAGLLVVLVVAAIVIVPLVFDVQQYKPKIEQAVSDRTGRSFRIGGEIDLSLFPWVGVRLSDLHLGNPDGFDPADMVSVKSFEVRVKVMPLLTRAIEVKTFRLESPVIHLEKPETGPANWEGMAQSRPDSGTAPKSDRTPSDAGSALPVASLKVDNFAISDGQVTYLDRGAQIEKKISDLGLVLTDLSFDKPVHLDFSARIDDRPVGLKGKIGPMGSEPGKGKIPMDLVLTALDMLNIRLNGQVSNPTGQPGFDVTLDVSDFSPRKLADQLGQPFPVKTADPAVLDKLALKARIQGTLQQVALSEGRIDLDDSRVDFDAKAKDFGKPDLTFNVSVDQLDLDRYLPPADQKTPEKKADKPEGQTGKKQDYEPLKRLKMDGEVSVGRLIARKLEMTDIRLKLTANDGLLKADPFSMALAGGTMDASAAFNVRRKNPYTTLKLMLKDIQAAPLIQAFMEKEIVEGTLKSDIDLNVIGDTPEMMRRTLNGSGQMVFKNGAIVGVDLTNLMHTVKNKMGTQPRTEKKPRTDFAELNIPFDIKKGLVTVTDAFMMSPLVRLSVDGQTSLPKETLDFKLTPKLVSTLKGQGDTKERKGIMVPVLVSGTFTQPKFRPDLSGVVGKGLPDAEGIKSVIGDKQGRKEKIESVKEDAKSMLQGLMPAQ